VGYETAHPREIFKKKLVNENAINPKVGDLWQFCSESLGPPGISAKI
jgi:hypothetical protein